MTARSDVTPGALRREAEAAIEGGASAAELKALLTKLLACAGEGTEHAVFAHRQLAELYLEPHPWRAALHLRQALRAEPHDDVLHALMGLCHALLGNYRAAVASYERALRAAPQTPWYHHNLGHLLDVALGEPARAERHLRLAHDLEPTHDEIAASLAHCLGRLGKLDQAERLAHLALGRSPGNADHRQLVAWIESGANQPQPGRVSRSSRGSSKAPVARRAAPASRAEGCATDEEARDADLRKRLAVVEELEARMGEAGFAAEHIDKARLLWADFHEAHPIRVTKPEVYAAAVEYTMGMLLRRSGLTQAAVARRYGVATTSVSSRYGQIRDVLSLRPGDPRYVR
ncbi:MAG: hypothetical protein KC543_02290 [Myxococcales bacterium]|nr:hypothetical protein [Myxococcales bacterium]